MLSTSSSHVGDKKFLRESPSKRRRESSVPIVDHVIATRSPQETKSQTSPRRARFGDKRTRRNAASRDGNQRWSSRALKDAPLRGSVTRRGANHVHIATQSFSFSRRRVWAWIPFSSPRGTRFSSNRRRAKGPPTPPRPLLSAPLSLPL